MDGAGIFRVFYFWTVMENIQENITCKLIQQAGESPERAAIHSRFGVMNYRELNASVWRTAQFLHDQGVRSTDVVMVRFDDELFRVLVMLGLNRLGATFFSVPRMMAEAQFRDGASRSRARFLATDVAGANDDGLSVVYCDFRKVFSIERVDETILCKNPASPLMIVSGSGSTGVPKMIPITHGNMAYRSSLSSQDPVFHDGARLLVMSGMEFANSFSRLWGSIYGGFCVMLSSAVNEDLNDFCEKNLVTSIACSVLHLENILEKYPDVQLRVLSSVKVIRVGSSMFSEDLKKRAFERLGIKLVNAYSTNECGMIAKAVFPGENSEGIGLPLTGVTIEVVRPDGSKTVDDEPGFIRVKSPGVVEGYLDDEASTKKSFVAGWFYPGDVAKRSLDGRLTYLGRTDGMMVMNGINIFPAEIENSMRKLPAVKDVVAFPYRHKIHQDVPVCAVVLREQTDVSVRELLLHAQENLGFRAPREIIVLNEIPRDERGKLNKTLLVQMVTAAKMKE